MTNIVNLNRHKKRVAQNADAEQAASNRAKFGRTKAAKLGEAHEQRAARQSIEAHRIVKKDER